MFTALLLPPTRELPRSGRTGSDEHLVERGAGQQLSMFLSDSLNRPTNQTAFILD